MTGTLKQSPTGDLEKDEKLPILSAQKGSQCSVLYLIGAVLMVVSVLSMALQQEVMQRAESGGTVNKPGFSIWFNHSCLFIAGLPISCLLEIVRTRSFSPVRMWSYFLEKQGCSAGRVLLRMALLSLVFLFPYMAWAITLSSISISIVTAARGFDSVFVLLFSSLLSLRLPSVFQIVACLACVVGVTLTAIGQHSEDSSIMGSTSVVEALLALISPVFAAVFYMLFNKLTKGSGTDAECMCIILGLIGLINILVLWPVIPFSYAAGFDGQPLRDVFTAQGVRSIILNAALATCTNFLTMPALTLTSPLFVALSTPLLLPVTLIIDCGILHHTRSNAWLICGAILTVLAFCCVAWAEAAAEERPGSDETCSKRIARTSATQ